MTDLAGKIATPLCAAGTLAVAVGATLPWARSDEDAGIYVFGDSWFGIWSRSHVLTVAMSVCFILGVVAFGLLMGGGGRKAAAATAVGGTVTLVLLVIAFWDDEAAYSSGWGMYVSAAALVGLVAAGMLAATRSASGIVLFGAALVVTALFLPWYPSASEIEGAYFNRSVGAPAYSSVYGEFPPTGWLAFTVVDFLLVAVAALGVGAVWSAFRGRRDRRTVAAAAAAPAAIGMVLVFWRIVDPPFDVVRAAPAVALMLSALACIGGGAILVRRSER